MLCTCRIRTKKFLGRAIGCANPQCLEYEKEYEIDRIEKKKIQNTQIPVYYLHGFEGYFDGRIFEWVCNGLIFAYDKPVKNQRLNNVIYLNLKNKKYKKKRKTRLIDESQCISESEDMFFISCKRKKYVVLIKH